MVVAKPLNYVEMVERAQQFRFGPPFDTWKPNIRIEDTPVVDENEEVRDFGFWVHITIEVPDTDTGVPAAFTHSYPYFFHPDARLFDQIVISCVRQVVLHELGESLWLENDRPLYPHRP